MAKDDVEALCEDEGRGRVLLAGLLNLLRPGPEELLTALLAGCLLALALGALALVPAIVAVVLRHGQAATDACPRVARTSFGHNGEKLANVFFVKHENRTWTPKELCSIESAARRYSDLNFLVLNLLANKSSVSPNNLDVQFVGELVDAHAPPRQSVALALESKNEIEEDLNYQLVDLPNLRNIDVEVEKVFEGSKISRKVQSLRRDEIEFAARFQILWNAPGITLEPLLSYQLESYRNFIDADRASAIASLQIYNDFQASSVPCQSFIGLVVDKIAKSSSPDRQSALNSAFTDFCSSVTDCSGVRILQQIPKQPPNFTSCPNTNDILEFITTNRIDDNLTI